MGVLQRFERRLEGLVEGAFARAFGGRVEPVEVAAALQREAGDKRAIVGEGRVLVPNDYVVELGASDYQRFAEYDLPLRSELAAMVREHAEGQGWSFVGPVGVRFQTVEGLTVGTFRVHGRVLAADDALPRRPVPAAAGTARPRLILCGEAGVGDRAVPLDAQVLVLGRGSEADLRVADTGVSRRHAEVRRDAGGVTITDTGSTNGTVVNGRRVTTARLRDGDVVEIGVTRLVFRDTGDDDGAP